MLCGRPEIDDSDPSNTLEGHFIPGNKNTPDRCIPK